MKEAVRVAFGISGITDEDEARDIARNAAAFEKVRVEKAPVVEIVAEPVVESPVAEIKLATEWADEWPAEIVEAEAAVNAFLLSKEQITEGQTFRDLSDDAYRKRVLANTQKFLAAVNAASQKEAA